MGKRIVVAAVFLPLVYVIFFMLPPVFIPIAVCILSAIAVHEVLRSTGFVRSRFISVCSILFSALVPFWVYTGENMFPALNGILFYTVLLFMAAIFSKGKVSLEEMGGTLFFSIIIPYFLSSFTRIMTVELSTYYVLIPLLSAFTSDAFALFAGISLGKHKLAPTLSPNKTVEGAVGGFTGAVVCNLLYGLLMQKVFHLNVVYMRLIIYGAAGSLISQFGDLSFSYIKRHYGIKDYGNIFPGHGGVLDRFDSVIFCAPLTEYLIRVLPAFWR